MRCIKIQGAVQGSEALVVPNTRSYATGIWQGEGSIELWSQKSIGKCYRSQKFTFFKPTFLLKSGPEIFRKTLNHI
jgi:hypothetical protein